MSFASRSGRKMRLRAGRAKARRLHIFVTTERAAELDFGEAVFVAELVGGFSEFFQFFAALGFQEIQLLGAVR